jgi:hypothetical protein
MNVSRHVIRNAGSHMRWAALVIGLSLFIIICAGALQSSAVDEFKDEFKIVTVKRGDSISYLSFKLYKKYNTMIADSIRSCNPEIKNVNVVFVGQKIRFPRLTYIEQGKYLSEKEIKVEKRTPVAAPTGEAARSNVAEMEAFITYLDGDVKISRRGTSDWQPARTNQELFEGDQIRVNKNSVAELITEKNSVIRLSENSALEITKLEKDPEQEKETSRFSLSLGRLWNRVRKFLSSKSEYTVCTPTALSGVRGTVYSIDILSNNDTRFKTYSGSINVWNPSEGPIDEVGPPRKVSGPVPVPGPHPVGMKEWTSIILKKHEALLVTKEGPLSKEAFDPIKDRDDAWVEWNVERDQDLEKSEPWL